MMPCAYCPISRNRWMSHCKAASLEMVPHGTFCEKNGQKNHAWVSSFFLVVPCTCPVQETWMFHCEAASLDWIQHGTFAENKHSEKTQTVKCMPCIQWFMSTLMFQMLALRPFPLLGRDSKPWRLGVRLGKVASLHLIILGDFGSFQVSICGWNPFASHKRISFFSGAMNQCSAGGKESLTARRQV